MARSDARTKGLRKVNYSSRWDPEYLEWLKAEAARRTKTERLNRACLLAGSGQVRKAQALYQAAEQMGTLNTLGPEVSVADVLHMAVDHYRAAG